MHIPLLYKFAKIFTNNMENPALPPFLRNIPTPPRLNDPDHSVLTPPPINFLSLFPNFVSDENKYFGIEIPENKFYGRAHAENNLSR